MELHKLSVENIKEFDSAKIRETEADIRKELVNIRMDIYTARNQQTAKIRGLKKSLARLLTLENQGKKAAVKPAKTSKDKGKKS